MKYKDTGVDIDKANEAVKRIKDKVKSTYDKNVLTELGSFGGLYELRGYKNPVLVSGTDGVGTKLKLAFLAGKHSTVGIDLVAMSVNDILVQGAKPLFFLDYIATSNLKPEVMEEIVGGIAEGCKISSCSLLGGEMAELPGFYQKEEYDLAGFAVGACEKENIITGENIEKGDVLIGLHSSGLHSNGFSLARKVLIDEKNPDEILLEEMLTPTKIYTEPVMNLIESINIKGMVHITGGGFYENIPRILPDNLAAKIEKSSWEEPNIFKMISSSGNISQKEMFKTFNMGIGYIIVVEKKQLLEARNVLKNTDYDFSIIGNIFESKQKKVVIN
ncbi:MAG: phosphoribosylformylglycinamidine cyclo-ligase [Candidatus Mcinerneyibacterium aminivorans]|jgi:phosphoribosylformylglycinamidine cyclo-ligase|uniref:Phosphoribosylformylglycinamidine cyclo-ligase n=1 Tax=Candidatus Mcinerneyibacterium aminivorans TaxID=2703815 RepID=A0A5D0MGH1_9BACT|nr:MAG: phosphoribosylformylglycinamidine cyclo-ligase [Candidatus Mcinerneyibacterium aminivorans]